MQNKIWVWCLLVLATSGCFSVDAPDKRLLSMAERLGKLHCISNTYHNEMRPIFEKAQELSLESDSLFVHEKNKHYKCLRKLNAELIALQTDFDKEMIALGGHSSAATQPYYKSLELSLQESPCLFTTYCNLNFKFSQQEY